MINGPISKTHFLRKKFPGITEYIGFKKIHRGKQGLQDINEIEEDHRIVAWRHRQEITEDRYIQIPDWAFSFESFESPDKPLDLIINCGSLSEAILSQYLKENC